MKPARIVYRLRQFWHALHAVPDASGLQLARRVLSPAEMALFTQMQPSEQAHSLGVLRKIQAGTGGEPSDLAVAALLHDVGKVRHPLYLWERVLVVLGKALFPEQAKGWGSALPVGWRRAFVIAEQHPDWGAEMAAQAGASPLAVTLIRRHQNQCPYPGVLLEDTLLQRLMQADQDS